MKVGIKIFVDEDIRYKIHEINNPDDEGYALYTTDKTQTNSDLVNNWMYRVGIIDYRDKFLQRMINRFK